MGLYAGTALLSQDLRLWLGRCDLAVGWMEDKDGTVASVLQQCGVQRVLIQSPFSRTLHAKHQRDRFLESIGEPAADLALESPLLLPEGLLEQAKALLDSRGIVQNPSLVLVHPGSGSILKCMKPKAMASILQWLDQRGMHVLLLEGPDDQDIVRDVLTYSSKKPPILKDLDLSLLAGVLAHVSLYIGHDSGVTHVAALLGVPTIAIFGPTDRHRWAPRGKHVTIVSQSPCICHTWSAVESCSEKVCLDVSVDELGRELSTPVRA
jgi:ADP-heptose:LPS heptosyltransferase